MSRGEIKLAISECDSLVWATEALLHREYYCVRCWTVLSLDCKENIFRHPASAHCSSLESNRKSGLLYLYRALKNPRARVQIQLCCELCRNNFVTNIRGEKSNVHLISTPRGEAIFLNSAIELLLIMRPVTASVRQWIKSINQFWIELDARNVLSGGPLAALESHLPDWRKKCRLCHLKYSKVPSEQTHAPIELFTFD